MLKVLNEQRRRQDTSRADLSLRLFQTVLKVVGASSGNQCNLRPRSSVAMLGVSEDGGDKGALANPQTVA